MKVPNPQSMDARQGNMYTIHRNNRTNLLMAALILTGIALIIGGMALRPHVVAGHLSPDGIFGDGILDRLTIVKICRWGLFGIGALMLSFAIFKWSGFHRVGGMAPAVDDAPCRTRTIRAVIAGIFLVLALLLLNKAIHLSLGDKWKTVIGYEYYWIAESLAGGHGFSVPASHRWYYVDHESEYPDDQYHPTALEEPVYPYLLAFAFRNLGEYGRLVVLLLNLVAIYMTALLIYFLVRKVFDSRLGVIASVALLTWWWYEVSWLTVGVISPAVLGGFGITCSAYLLLWSLEKISVKRGMILGFMLAVSCLTLAASMLFIPLAVLFTLIWKRPVRPLAWRPAISVIAAAVVVFFPWTLRNYIEFQKFIPVRTGFGLALHQSNPILAATFSSGTHACVDELGPIWRANNAKDAILQVRKSKDKRQVMYKRGFECIGLKAPDDFSGYNEAQRDEVYLETSIDFIRSNPKIFLVMTRHRIQSFLVGWSPQHTLLTLLAFAGALLSWRNPKTYVLVMLLGAYTFTFSMTTALMYRYRYPIDPIMFVLACGIPAIIFSTIKSWTGKATAT